MTKEEISELVQALSIPFYLDVGFWIGIAIGLTGIYFSVKAFQEAREAKQAAFEAGKTVKIQTITIELTEIAQRLDKLDYSLKFSEARDLLNEVNRRLRRLIAPFQSTPDMQESCSALKIALENAKAALDDVRPNVESISDLPTNLVYFATQGHFATISGLVAEILGLFEKRTIEVPGNGI